MMANTAFSDRDVAGRRRGVGELNNAIVGAVRAGDGTREQAADTLDNLLASGAVSDKSAMALLPALQNFATATGAGRNELGNIAIRAMQNFGINQSKILAAPPGVRIQCKSTIRRFILLRDICRIGVASNLLRPLALVCRAVDQIIGVGRKAWLAGRCVSPGFTMEHAVVL
ncbi:hypothetical protein [Paraburkholderia graminis]|uniref:hypothetical protein n=1 Tax=Paraburkholderia graminis TaxID=60548 RepID=UPI0038B6E4A2